MLTVGTHRQKRLPHGHSIREGQGPAPSALRSTSRDCARTGPGTGDGDLSRGPGDDPTIDWSRATPRAHRAGVPRRAPADTPQRHELIELLAGLRAPANAPERGRLTTRRRNSVGSQSSTTRYCLRGRLRWTRRWWRARAGRSRRQHGRHGTPNRARRAAEDREAGFHVREEGACERCPGTTVIRGHSQGGARNEAGNWWGRWGFAVHTHAYERAGAAAFGGCGDGVS